MFSNTSRIFLGGVIFCGVAAYGYSRSRNYSLQKRIENAPAVNQIKSIQDINNSSEKCWQEKLKINLMYAQEALQYTAEALPQ